MKKILFLLGLFLVLALQSCNVTRVVETKSSYWQSGDTTCTIFTKTAETYDAKKNLNY